MLFVVEIKVDLLQKNLQKVMEKMDAFIWRQQGNQVRGHEITH